MPRTPVMTDPEIGDEAVLAAEIAAAGVVAARFIQWDLMIEQFSQMEPHRGESATPVDNVPCLITDVKMADEVLRTGRLPEEQRRQRNSYAPSRSEQLTTYVNERSYRELKEYILSRHPNIRVFGKGDRLTAAERGRRITSCITKGEAFAVLDALDGAANFLTFYSETTWAVSVILSLGRGPIASAVATGPVVAVALNGDAFIFLEGRGWFRASEITNSPESELLFAVPLDRPADREDLHGITHDSLPIVGLSGNPMIIRGGVLGAASAIYQPGCPAWDAAGMAVAAAAGRLVCRADRRRVYPLTPDQVDNHLITALSRGQHVPPLITGRRVLAVRHLMRLINNGGRNHSPADDTSGPEQ
jgi:fructose-1,6-bisphosphatase/inositol monophosphatase family enzyme